MRKAKEFRDMSIEELVSLRSEMDREIFDLRNEQMQSKKMDQPHRLKHTKKERARLLTVLRQKQ